MSYLLIYLAGVCVSGLLLFIGERLLGDVGPSNWTDEELAYVFIASILSWMGIVITATLLVAGLFCEMVERNEIKIKERLLKDRPPTNWWK